MDNKSNNEVVFIKTKEDQLEIFIKEIGQIINHGGHVHACLDDTFCTILAEFLKGTQYGISVEEILYGMYYVKIVDYTTDTCQGDKLSTITALMETDIDKIVNRLSSSNIPLTDIDYYINVPITDSIKLDKIESRLDFNIDCHVYKHENFSTIVLEK